MANVIRELVTVLRYQVDKSGLDIYLQSAKKAGADARKAIDEATNRAPRPAPRTPAPQTPQTPPGVVNVPGLGPGTWKPVPGKMPVFIPHVPAVPTAPLGPPPIPPTPPVVPGAPGGAVPGAPNNGASVASVRSAVTGVGSQIRSLLSGAVAFLGVHEVFKMADEWATVNARIGLVTENAKEQKEVLGDIYDISQRTRQSYGETATLIFNMRQATEHAGVSMKDTLRAAEAFNNALLVGGGTAANNRRAIYELNHALEIGQLSGMQLRSLRMEAPIFIRTLSEQLAGGDPAKLSQMATAGQLKTKSIVDAMNKAFDELKAKADKMPLTIGQGVTKAGNIIGKLINDIGQASGAFQDFAHLIVTGAQDFADAIRWSADEVGGFGNLLTLAGIAAASLFGAKIIAGAWELVAAIRAAGLAALVLEAPFWLIFAALVLVGLVIQDIVKWVQGAPSLFGDWFGSVEKFKKELMDAKQALLDLIHLKSTGPALQVLSKTSGDAADIITGPLEQKTGTWLDQINPITQARNMFSFLGGLRMPSVGLMGLNSSFAGGSSNTTTTTINAPINITTADNPAAIGSATRNGIRQAASQSNMAASLGPANPTVEAN